MARKQAPEPSLPTDDVTRSHLTVDGLSARSGVSVPTIHRWKAQGKIPFFQPAGKGGKLLFPPDALERTVGLSASPDQAKPSIARAQGQLSGPAPAWMRAVHSPLTESPNAP